MSDTDPISESLGAVVYGLAVVGSISSEGEPNGMTANWMSQVSFAPRIFAVAIQDDAHTRANIDATNVFAISVLPEGSKDLSLKFTAKSTSGEGRLEGEPITTYATGAPILDTATAWLECRVVDQVHPGDHVIYFGEVIGGGVGTGTSTTLRDTGMSYSG